MINVVPGSEQREYTVALPVYDVRDYSSDAPGIYTFGGFIGELMITLHTLNEYMNTKSDTKIEMDESSILKFLEELLVDGYPHGICTIKLSDDPLSEVERQDNAGNTQDLAILAAKRIQTGKQVTQYGLKFFLDVASRVGIASSIVNDILQAICKIHYHEP